MRVLFWSGPFWPAIGGVQVFAATILPALQARGYEFVVVTQQHRLHLPEEAGFAGIPVYRLPFYTLSPEENIDRLERLAGTRQQVARLKRSFAPDLIHINSFTKSVLFHLDTVSAHAAPCLVTVHTSHQPQLPEATGRDTILRQTLRQPPGSPASPLRRWLPRDN